MGLGEEAAHGWPAPGQLGFPQESKQEATLFFPGELVMRACQTHIYTGELSLPQQGERVQRVRMKVLRPLRG